MESCWEVVSWSQFSNSVQFTLPVSADFQSCKYTCLTTITHVRDSKFNSLLMEIITPQTYIYIVSFPDPTPTRGKGSGVLRAISWASRMQNSHVILIIVMATHCLVPVCGSRMQQHCLASFAPLVRCHMKNHMP